MNESQQMKFNYVFSADYNPHYCNGAYGGIAPHGEIIANFFLERMPIPKSLTQQIDENGLLGSVIETEPDDLNGRLVRYVSTGIILNEDSARAIYNWLGEQLMELDRRKAFQVTSEPAQRE